MSKVVVEKEASLIIPLTLKAGTGPAQDNVPPLKAGTGPAPLTLKAGTGPAQDNVPPAVHGSDSHSETQDKLPSLPSTQSPNKRNVSRTSSNRQDGNVQKTMAFPVPDVVKQMYTGKLPPTYVKNLSSGRAVSSRESSVGTRTRTKELWEPRRPSREKARHAIRDIQDARFRKQERLESVSVYLDKRGRRNTEAALMRESAMMPRGLQSFLMKNEREKEAAEARIRERKEQEEARIRERKEKRRNTIT